MLLFLLAFIYGIRADTSDCSHLGGAGVDQCIVGFLDDDEVLGIQISCDGDGGWTIDGYDNNQCKGDPVKDDLFPLDITALCSDADSTVCQCGTKSDIDSCYILLEDYADCDEDGEVLDEDLTFSVAFIVGQCVYVDDDDDEYNPFVDKWKKIECNPDQATEPYEPWTEIYYTDKECSKEYTDADWDCSTLTSEVIDCTPSEEAMSGFYCGRFEGHPLGVCSISGTFTFDDDDGVEQEYMQSEIYWCDEAQDYYKTTYYYSGGCDGEYYEDEQVECSEEHNCRCDISHKDDCTYDMFSYSVTGTCQDATSVRGTVEYSVVLDKDACFKGDDQINGYKYTCDASDDTLDFTIYFDDATCTGDESCTYTKIVDCDYMSVTSGNCNYVNQYPIDYCAINVDEDGDMTSYMFQCNTDGSIQTLMFDDDNCTMSNVVSNEPCTSCDDEINDPEDCQPCTGYCGATDPSQCNLAEYIQMLECTTISTGAAVQTISATEYYVTDECSEVGQYWRKDTCDEANTLITQTVYDDAACTNMRDECTISEYEGDYGLDLDESDADITECTKLEDDSDCGYVDVFPVDTCILGYDDQKFAQFSAEYTCSDNTWTVNVYESFDCSGTAVEEYGDSGECGDGSNEDDILCNCDGSGAKCSTLKFELTDSCLLTETYLVIMLPPECSYIDEIEADWDIYFGLSCNAEGDGIEYGFYEDSECTEDANILRYKDEYDCTHEIYYDGKCGSWGTDPTPGGTGGAYRVQLLFTAIITIFYIIV